MKYEAFKKEVQSFARGIKPISYFYATLYIAMGLFFWFGPHFTETAANYEETHKREYPILIPFVMSAFFISLGIRGLWVTSKLHKIEVIKSDHITEQKEEILTKVVQDLNLAECDLYEYKHQNDYKRFRYTTRFRTPYRLYITYDSNQFSFFVGMMGNGLAVSDGQLRAAKKIGRAIQSYVDAESTP
jgi:hypothetical protein